MTTSTDEVSAGSAIFSRFGGIVAFYADGHDNIAKLIRESAYTLLRQCGRIFYLYFDFDSSLMPLPSLVKWTGSC